MPSTTAAPVVRLTAALQLWLWALSGGDQSFGQGRAGLFQAVRRVGVRRDLPFRHQVPAAEPRMNRRQRSFCHPGLSWAITPAAPIQLGRTWGWQPSPPKFRRAPPRPASAGMAEGAGLLEPEKPGDLGSL